MGPHFVTPVHIQGSKQLQAETQLDRVPQRWPPEADDGRRSALRVSPKKLLGPRGSFGCCSHHHLNQGGLDYEDGTHLS